VPVNSPSIDISIVATNNMYKFSKRTLCGFSNKFINTFVLPQFDEDNTTYRNE